MLLQSIEELSVVAQERPDELFALQTYLPNDGDYRVLVMGNEAKLVISRHATSESHLNNTSQGAEARLVEMAEVPAEVIEMSVQAAAFFGRDVAGVDIVQSKTDGKYYCFEVNRAPQIEHASFEPEKADALAAYLAGISK